jgi:SpoVK/Ycf46/Vps4 family AAA+-type ATPase
MKDDVLFLDLQRKYQITKNIYISTCTTTSQSDKGDYEYVTLEIILETKQSSFQIIHDFINQCKKEYEDELLNNMKRQHVFIFESINKEICKNIIYQEYPFETTKNFSNMYFDEKSNLLKKLDAFINNKTEYIRLGMPHTLGILLHGCAGTGKTSCIKSIAKYTNRHIVILPTKNIKNIETLKSIFLTEYINGTKIPNDKRLYVFEDIDCGSWQNIVSSRKNTSLPAEEAHPSSSEAMFEVITKLASTKNESKSDNKPINTPCEKNTLTLGDFLELLDGVIEIPGRMIIMTSNHPEMLDSALTRPGRIDVVIEFKKLSKQNVADMYKQWFNHALPDPVLQAIEDSVFTQADIGNLFSSQPIAKIHEILSLKVI